MSLLHSDVNISRCESCGGWQYMGWCWTCERPIAINHIELPEAV